jgi:alginate O-acetyltransferase complex protein AlgI
MGKKMLLANALGATTEIVFRIPAVQLGPAVAWIGIVSFMLQLYLDFSGYSDMAIGLGRLLGFRFPENFLYPYISRTIGEMWQRWHITLGTWLRDFLYIPLGSHRRAGNWVINRNLIIVFLACGLWHGASWNFVIWGMWNGAFLLFERTPAGQRLKRSFPLIPWAYTMLVWIGGLVLFKAGDPKGGGSLAHAWAYARHMVGLGGATDNPVPAAALVNAELVLGLVIGAVACFPVIPWLRRRYEGLRARATGARRDLIDRCWHYGRLVALILILLLSVELVASGAFNPFLYTQF